MMEASKDLEFQMRATIWGKLDTYYFLVEEDDTVRVYDDVAQHYVRVTLPSRTKARVVTRAHAIRDASKQDRCL